MKLTKEFKKLCLLYIWNTYIAWGDSYIFTRSYFGLETIIGRTLHIVGALGPAIAKWHYYLKENNIKFKHFVFY